MPSLELSVNPGVIKSTPVQCHPQRIHLCPRLPQALPSLSELPPQLIKGFVMAESF